MWTVRGYSSTRTAAMVVGLQAAALMSGCSDPGGLGRAAVAEQAAPLFARSPALWDVDGGRVTVSVCWAEPILNSTYPVASLAPDVSARLAERKQWARDTVESEWGGRTDVYFTGWQDCQPGTPAQIRLTPIDSATTAPCGDQGQSCVMALGREMVGTQGMFLNLLFGEEVLYSSRYQQANPGSSYRSDEDVNPDPFLRYLWWAPQACLEDFRYAWSTNNSLTRHPKDIEDPAVRSDFMELYESCLKFNVLHEFGHAVGFAHEHQRGDTAGDCNRETSPDVQYVADAPLGPFDRQSIMSYCRTDPSPTLSPQDAEQTRAVYGLVAGSGTPAPTPPTAGMGSAPAPTPPMAGMGSAPAPTPPMAGMGSAPAPTPPMAGMGSAPAPTPPVAGMGLPPAASPPTAGVGVPPQPAAGAGDPSVTSPPMAGASASPAGAMSVGAADGGCAVRAPAPRRRPAAAVLMLAGLVVAIGRRLRRR